MKTSERYKIESPGSFGMVPREVILDANVSARAVRFFAYLMALDKDADGFVRMEQAEVQSVFGSYSTIRACSAELKTAGHIELSYDRNAHLTTYKMLWGVLRADHKRHCQPVGGAFEHRQPVGDGTADQVADAHIADNIQTTPKAPAPTGAAHATGAKVRKDTRRALAFLARFEGWYQRVYRRPHSTPGRGEIFQTDALLRRVDRDRLRVPAVKGDPAETVIGCVLTVALRSKSQVWFLRNGEPLCLDEILSTKKWQVLWDKFLEEGQRLGYPMGEFDGPIERDSATAA